jgi:phosphoribosylformimino-5-aminoimidazole carboxamide ribotide isomerase
VDLYPAIDLRGGRCVRLHQGDFSAETVYSDDPVAVARSFVAAGARWIHVVDLDAARTGDAVNRAVIADLCASVDAWVECGGGVRTEAAAAALVDCGVARVVVGTAAVEHPELVDALCGRFPDRVAVGLDARGREVAVRGWVEGSGHDLLELATRFEASGVAALVVTEIGRDGTMLGPDLDQLRSVLAVTGLPVVASGGVGTLADLEALAGLEEGGRRLAGAIAGRAIYEGRFTVAEGLAAVAVRGSTGSVRSAPPTLEVQ